MWGTKMKVESKGTRCPIDERWMLQQLLEANKNEHQIDFKSQYCKLLLMSKDMMLLSILNPELPTCSSLKDCTLKYGIFFPIGI